MRFGLVVLMWSSVHRLEFSLILMWNLRRVRSGVLVFVSFFYFLSSPLYGLDVMSLCVLYFRLQRDCLK